MKKYVLIALLFTFIIGAGISYQDVAFAAEEVPVITEEMQGVDLGHYDVKLSYCNFILNTSGAYRAFEIIFDKNFIEEKLFSDDELFEFLNPLSELIKSMGYAPIVNTKSNSIKGELVFETLTDLYIAMEIDGYDNTKSNIVTQTSFLYKDIFIKQDSPFKNIEEREGALKDILSYFYASGIARDTILLNYIYGTPYKIVSSDADKVTYSVNHRIYLHSFDMNMDMTTVRKINLKQHIPNTAGWYGMAAIIALLVISVPLTITLLRYKNRKRATNG